MKATPVPLAQDPRQYVHLVMQLWRELGADQIRRSRSFPSRYQSHLVVVAAVLRRQRRAIVRQHRADAESGRRFVDVQALFGSARVPPAVGLAKFGVLDVDGAVNGLRGVRAGAAGELREHLVQVLLEEVILAV